MQPKDDAVFGPTGRGLAVAAVALLFLSLAAPRLRAQVAPFTAQGFVLDLETHGPVAAALVELVEIKRRTVTDSLGSFEFPNLKPGRYTIAVSALGYLTTREAGDFQAGFRAFMLLPPKPVELNAIEVAAASSMAENRRRASGFTSQAWATKQLRDVPATTLQDFVASYARASLVPCRAGLGQGPAANAGGECMLTRGEAMPIRVYVDETPSPSAEAALQMFRTDDVARVEVYRGLSMIRIYTAGFLDRVAKGQARLDPLCLVCTGP